MRPLLVVLLSVLILGGVKWFIDSDPSRTRSNRHDHSEVAQSENVYDVELGLTFDAGPDEFSIDLTDAPSLILWLNGKEILKRSEMLLANEPLQLSNVEGLIVGVNEFLVQATPAEQDDRPKALRLRILRDGVAVARQTVWAEPGDSVQATVRVEVTE